jgi:hypothetical protein
MKKHRKHKAKKRQRSPPPQPSPPLPHPPESPRKRNLGPWIAGFLALVASIFGIILFGDWARDQYSKIVDPEIAILDSDPASPFLFPFAVRNESPFLAMKEVTWKCSIPHLDAGNGNRLENVSIGFVGRNVEIAARSTTNVRCPIRVPPPTDRFKISVVVDFKSMGQSRQKQKQFVWMADASHPRWIEGD